MNYELLDIGGKLYFIDLNNIYKAVKVPNDIVTRNNKGNLINTEREIDISRWEVVKTMIEIVLALDANIDDRMGIIGLNNSVGVPFKVAFNTLIMYGILKEINYGEQN
jgi:hypothetical protein